MTLDKALMCVEDQYWSWLEALWKQGSNGMRSGGVGSDANVVGRGPVALSGCLVQRASTHNLYAVERPKKYGPHGELFFFLHMQKKPTFVPDSEAFKSYIGDGFLVPELKDESEASEDDQTDNVSNKALYVIGSTTKNCRVWAGHTEIVGGPNPAVLHFEQ